MPVDGSMQRTSSKAPLPASRSSRCSGSVFQGAVPDDEETQRQTLGVTQGAQAADEHVDEGDYAAASGAEGDRHAGAVHRHPIKRAADMY